VRGLTAIDENGMCEMWWRKGQRRVNSKMEQGAPLYREDLVILNEQKAEDVTDRRSEYKSRDSGCEQSSGQDSGNDGETVRDRDRGVESETE